MRLYFLRHGAADWPDWEGSDDERPLTKAGQRELHQVGDFLARLKLKLDLVLTSPLPRAAQTADIAAEHLRVRVREEKLLGPGFGVTDLKRLLRKYPQPSLMLVGHEPDFSSVIASLTGGKVKLAKAGVALVELDSGKGQLRWLFPPKIPKA
ncbi:MAG: phosphohistidine phosphatase SixA [Chthoniobacterales bacterium]|nr:phosphohistidine phosphatase SixA [Chthoniobacterales bacterium]